MIDFSNVTIDKIIVHQVGSKSAGEDIILSKSEVQITDEETTGILLTYFLKPFRSEEYYNFDFEIEYGVNKVFDCVSRIFSAEEEFYVQSANIAKHLFDVSVHPNIKKGELYIVYFSGVVVDGEITEAVGLFKSENKDVFIKVYNQGDKFGIDCDNGINIKKLDKGCLIYNVEQEQGYKISVVDHTNKNNEALYWKDDFLTIKPRTDNFFNTKAFLSLCKDFSEHVLTEDNEVERTEKIDFMDKSIKFFSKNEDFDVDKFKEQVIGNDEAITAFDDYRNEFKDIHELPMSDNFMISDSAVKNQKKYFRSVIKLDKNFHVYVHSRPEFIEKGFDNNKQLRFYKLYYETES